MSALRLARAATGRDRVIKFAGCYHGHGDAFLVQAGSGATTLGVPNSPGVPKAVAADTLVARYNDLDSVAKLLRSHRRRVAAIIVEPLAGNMGVVPPIPGFLEGLRSLSTDHSAILIFDEVICGFGRLGAPFGAQAFGVTPDVMTMAKALTNAAQPMGAVAVSDKVHSTILEAAPEGAVEFFHGYTYSAHPAACAAGLATMDLFEKEDLVARADALSPYFLDQVFALSDLEIITDIRGYGLFAGIDISPEGGAGVRGLDFQKRLYRNGLHIKMTGDAALLAPPLIAEPKHVDRMCEILRQTLLEY